MANIINIGEVVESQVYSETENGNSAQRIFLAQCSPPTINAYTILSDSTYRGSNSVNLIPRTSDVHPNDPMLYCKNVSTDKLDLGLWKFTCDYSVGSLAQGNQAGVYERYPWKRPAYDVSWSGTQQEYFPLKAYTTTDETTPPTVDDSDDTLTDPIINSAKSQFDPGVSFYRAISQVTFSFNTRKFDVNLIPKLIGSINRKPVVILGLNVGYGKAHLIDLNATYNRSNENGPSGNANNYWKLNVTIEFYARPGYEEILDIGYYVLESGKKKPIKTKADGTLTVAVDPIAENVTEPQLLNGSGSLLLTTSASEPVYLKFWCKPRIDWATCGINLPTSITKSELGW